MNTVAVIDPRPIWSAGIAALVADRGFQVVGRWPALGEALPGLLRAPPDILLVSLPPSGVQAAGDLLRLKGSTAIVLVVEPGEPIRTQDLPDVGIDALLAADASAESVANCLSCVAAGHAWLDPAAVRSLGQHDGQSDWSCLSDRELEVARLAAAGLSNKRIARTLHLSDGTVKIHMHHIFSKLHVQGRAALSRNSAAPVT